MAVLKTALLCLLLALPGSAWTSAPARLDQVQSDPFYSAWVVALEKHQAISDAIRTSGKNLSECGSDTALRDAALEAHHTRVQLMESLAQRGLSPAPPPAGVAPWPWGSAAGKTPTLSHFDKDNVSVLVDDGRMVFINLRANPEVDGAFAAQAFYENHHDEYDFLMLFTDFFSDLFNGRFRAYHLAVSNEVQGLGYQNTALGDNFNVRRDYTNRDEPQGALQSFVHLNDIRLYPENPDDTYLRSYSAVAFMLHEFSHRWTARLRIWQPLLGPQNQLLGRGDVHWSFFANAGGSYTDGVRWVAEGDGFRTVAATSTFGPLDLYLMGLLHPSEIDEAELFYLQSPTDFEPPQDLLGQMWNSWSPPQVGVFCRATRVDYDMDAIFLGNSVRRPLAPNAPKTFRAATVMVIPSEGSATVDAEIAKINVYQQRISQVFHEETLQRGTLDLTLNSIPARIALIHQPQGDLEQANQNVEIVTGLELTQRSLPTTLDDIQATLYYRINMGSEVAVAMQRGADDLFRAMIPGQPLGSRIDYWLKAASDYPGHEFTLPANAPADLLSYQITADTLPPTIQHVRVDHHASATEPLLVRALVRDSHAVAAVYFEFRQAPGGWQRQELARQGVSDIFETRVALPGRPGSEIEYRIVAEDNANTPHIGTDPAGGFYLLRITVAQEEDAELEDPLWNHFSLKINGIDQWHREPINHTPGGQNSWKLGPSNISTNPRVGRMELDQDAVLQSPAVRLTPDWSLTFFHRYYLRLSPPDTDFSAVDGAVVEWQDIGSPQDVPNDVWYPIDPVGDYPKLLSSYAIFNPLKGRRCWSGQNDNWRPVTFDHTGSARNLGNRLIRFRFRCASTPLIWLDLPGAGWYIDDIVISPNRSTTAIALEDVQARRDAQGITLTWKARNVLPGEDFRIYRADTSDPQQWQLLAQVDGVVGIERYTFQDNEAPRGEDISYRLTLLRDGVEIIGHVVVVQGAPLRFHLSQNTPNPFNPQTRIQFELPQSGPVQLAIYDVRGRRVRLLVATELTAGAHARDWDGTDDAGRRVASGVYLYRLSTRQDSSTHRMLLVQ